MNYPGGLKRIKTAVLKTTHANRGMALECDINITNEYYLINDIAVIYKKPTPITVAEVDYKSRVDAVIKKAYYKTPSTTDYNGLYKGKYIDFEAKETVKKEGFPLSNIHDHQIKHLKNIIKHGGIGFIIVRFTSINETYLLEGSKLFSFIANNTKKVIPIKYFQEEGIIIKDKFQPRVDYLEIVDKIYFGGK